MKWRVAPQGQCLRGRIEFVCITMTTVYRMNYGAWR
jgi:hypothetical protein